MLTLIRESHKDHFSTHYASAQPMRFHLLTEELLENVNNAQYKHKIISTLPLPPSLHQPQSVGKHGSVRAVLITTARRVLTSAGYLAPATVCSEPLSSQLPQWK